MVTGDSRSPGRVVPEKDIQKAILQYLRLRGYLCKRNNAGMTFGEYKGKKWAIRIGDVGWPDIEGITPEGYYFGIEVKTVRGEPTDEQLARGKQINAHGMAKWFVARSVDDVIAKGF